MPNLGISRPYIFDLLPGGSFVEHMTREGFDFFLLDWGVFGPEDNDLGVEECVSKILPRMARKVLEVVRRARAVGPRLLHGRARSPRPSWPRIRSIPVRNFINMAGPIDFSKVGLFGLWLDKRFFNVDRFVDTLGTVPADLVKAGFKLIKPTMDLSTNLNLWWNLWNDKYVEGFNALNKWANEYVAFPGEFFRQWVRDFYQDNKLYRGELVVRWPPRPARQHHLSGLRGGGQGGLHRAAGVRARAHRRRGQPRQGVRGAARWAHLADRRPRRRDSLLAQGVGLAGRALVSAHGQCVPHSVMRRCGDR